MERPPLPVWPDNRPAVLVFLAMRTQWRVGMSGCTGLDYAALGEVWERVGIDAADRSAVFADLQHVERGALAAMHED